MDAIKRFGPLAGRILIAIIFVFSGVAKLTGLDGTSGYIASKGLPFPYLLAVAAMLVELGGGILLVIGLKTRWAAAAILLFTVAAAFLFHNFWGVPAGGFRGRPPGARPPRWKCPGARRRARNCRLPPPW